MSALVVLSAIAEEAPAWVTDHESVYPVSQYLTALESSKNRKEAEANAVEGLAAIFDRSIQSETKTAISIQEKKSGTTAQAEKTKSLHKDIAVSTKIDNFVGVEIKDWKHSDGTYYVLAVLNKSKAASLYMDMIRKNNAVIAEFTGISDSEKYTLNGYCRYNAARLKAKENEVFLSRLVFLNAGAASLVSDETTRAASLDIACTDIAQKIPIAIAITGDKTGKLKAAFGSVFSAQGFKSASGQSERYRLNGSLSINEPVPQGSNKILIRYTFEASLEDSNTGEIIAPYTVNGKEIHFNQASAESKLLISLEKKIKSEFAKQFTAYLQIQQ
ncbi:MAG: LPP20 family lipoprotein [Treponema sp.]